MTQPKPPASDRLGRRNLQIVLDTAMSRLMTNEILHRHHFSGQRPNAVTRITARLCQEGWLCSFPLLYPQKYFLPGKRTIQHFGLPVSRCQPLGPQALPTEYAILEYTWQRPRPLPRLQAAELRQRFPWYEPAWTEPAHCLRTSRQREIVELLRVDLGGPADHLARKSVRDIEVRMQAPQFPVAIKTGQFRLVVITATTDKATAVQSALDAHIWPPGLSIHLAVITNLLPLLPRCT